MGTLPNPAQCLGIGIVLRRWDRQLEAYLEAFEGPDLALSSKLSQLLPQLPVPEMSASQLLPGDLNPPTVQGYFNQMQITPLSTKRVGGGIS